MTRPARPADRARMDRTEALETLPPAYRRLLQLLDADTAPARIAADLGVEDAGLPVLAELAHAKLATRVARGDES